MEQAGDEKLKPVFLKHYQQNYSVGMRKKAQSRDFQNEQIIE